LVKEVSTSVKEIETLVKEDETKDPKLNALYKMIWRNTVESCMPDAQYNVYKVAITAPQEHQYQHILEIPVFLGWKKVVEKSPDADAESALLMHIQLLIKQNKPIPYNQIDSVVVIHKHHQHYTEAGLINKMEDLGIGRPSTFATLVDTIIERGYVKIADVPGIEHECTEYKLNKILGQGTEQGLSKTIIKRQFGQEKNKLIIQPTGILCIEFLMQHFSPLFSYDYTKNMEEDLDKIAESAEVAKTWWKICERVNQEIKELTKPVENVAKQLYKLDETHSLIFHQYGVSIKHILGNGDTEYLPVKKSIQIDLDKLKQGKYTLDELLEFKKANLGKYEDQEMMLKMGQYGPYVEWGENKKSIQDIGIPLDQITIENIISFLKKEEETSQETDKSENKHILRVINSDISIRRGKFGNYIYYKTATMKAPKFIPLKKFKSNSLTCDIQEIVALVQS
jgi:DNA topoisomerase-1